MQLAAISAPDGPTAIGLQRIAAEDSDQVMTD